jgi:phosphate-selective porin OprO/OprP
VKWSPGPTISSKDGGWSVHVRGRLFADGGVIDDDDDFYDGDNATELRAARLGIEGKFLQGFQYKFETDFADNDVDIKDAFLEYGGAILDPVHLRVGQFKTPNSLEEQTSSRFITFMERAAITDAFELDRRIGLGTGLKGDNWGVEAGLFGQNAGDDEANEGFAVAGRGHYAFLDGSGGGRDAIHLGASLRYRELDNDVDDGMVRYRQRPFFHFTDTRSVNTGFIDGAESDVFVGGEFAWVHGPLTFQSEMANTALQLKEGSDPDNLWGGYAGLSYFLTGEQRSYNPKSGAFGRVKVNDPLHEGGAGAWEIGARLDYLDLNDGVAQGGEQYSVIAGLNWYPNNYARIMLNGTVTQVNDAAGDAAATGSENTIWGIGTRLQVDW